MSAAAEQLLRILKLVPLATRKEGIGLAEAARILDVSENQVKKDIRRIQDRGRYLEGGSADYQIFWEGDRLLIQVPPAFDRPVRLLPDELLACALALRSQHVDPEERVRLLGVVEYALAKQSTSTDPDRNSSASEPEVVFEHDPGGHRIYDTICRGIVQGYCLKFLYLKPGAGEAEMRTLEPWRVLNYGGNSYLTGHDRDRNAPRQFRIDRMLNARVTDIPVEVSPDEDALRPDADGLVPIIGGDESNQRWARVRYSPVVARWARERWDGEDVEDGSFIVQHRVLSVEWIVRHVLSYGAEAELLDPEDMRAQLLKTVES